MAQLVINLSLRHPSGSQRSGASIGETVERHPRRIGVCLTHAHLMTVCTLLPLDFKKSGA